MKKMIYGLLFIVGLTFECDTGARGAPISIVNEEVVMPIYDFDYTNFTVSNVYDFDGTIYISECNVENPQEEVKTTLPTDTYSVISVSDWDDAYTTNLYNYISKEITGSDPLLFELSISLEAPRICG